MAFEGREVEKEYFAIVQGTPAEKEGVIDIPIIEHSKKKGMMVPAKNGKPSITEYRVIQSFDRFSTLALFPRTGRTHQIRVHCKAIGHPLAVDRTYGEREAFFLSEIKKNYKRGSSFDEERPVIARCTLHAKSIRFCHPADGRPMFIESPVPKDMNALISQLSKLRRNG
jgi:23S rRNA pseudouridine955/2504/2580 synthase/23S rRNA pseudouridine1911/1915/1917 synthase